MWKDSIRNIVVIFQPNICELSDSMLDTRLLSLKDRFCVLFFILGRVLGHLCNVLLQNNGNLKQNIAKMSRTRPRIKNKIQNPTVWW